MKFKFSHPIILSLISRYLNNPKVNLNLMFALNLGTIYLVFFFFLIV